MIAQVWVELHSGVPSLVCWWLVILYRAWGWPAKQGLWLWLAIQNLMIVTLERGQGGPLAQSNWALRVLVRSLHCSLSSAARQYPGQLMARTNLSKPCCCCWHFFKALKAIANFLQAIIIFHRPQCSVLLPTKFLQETQVIFPCSCAVLC